MLNLYENDKRDWSELLFIGMGNRIKSDDGVGIYIADKLISNGLENVIIAENSIENYIGKINKHPARTIIIIDAVDMDEKPGYFKLIPIDKIVNTTTNTHNLSLDTISSFLTAPEKWVLAIQPKEVSFGMEISNIIIERAEKLIDYILNKVAIIDKIHEL